MLGRPLPQILLSASEHMPRHVTHFLLSGHEVFATNQHFLKSSYQAQGSPSMIAVMLSQIFPPKLQGNQD